MQLDLHIVIVDARHAMGKNPDKKVLRVKLGVGKTWLIKDKGWRKLL